jgi:coproporphyrinogen III oxidase-like Fe-S oxidoreductase
MALHVDVALQIEPAANVCDDFAKPALEHRGRSSASYVKGGNGLVARDVRIEVHLFLDRLDVSDREIVFTRTVPSREQLRAKLEDIGTLGLYLHIPFCEQICPYCPYNKELYGNNLAERYIDAVKTEMDFYSEIAGDKPITSLYIGGGTPTTMLHSGLGDIIGHMRDVFNLQCDIHMESHPNHLSAGNLSKIKSMGVQHLSIGVESLVDRHLKSLGRTYTAKGVKEAVRRAVSEGFRCVNVDVMFALPGQTYREIEQTGRELV